MSRSLVRRALRAATQAAVASTLLVAVAATAQAQQPVSKDQPPAGGGMGGGMGGGRGAGMTKMLKDSLGLSDAQVAKIDSINAAYRGKMQGLDQDARRSMMAERTTAVKAVLTAEQATKYDALMAAMRANMGGGRPPAVR